MGAVILPINSKLHSKEVKWILKNAKCSVVLTNELHAFELKSPDLTILIPKWDNLLGKACYSPITRSSDDLAWLFYTSGTTGRPKGVMITHGMIKKMVQSYFTDVDQIFPNDTTLYAAPMSHGAGLYSVMHVLAGARHAMPLSGGFDEKEIFSLAKSTGCI